MLPDRIRALGAAFSGVPRKWQRRSQTLWKRAHASSIFDCPSSARARARYACAFLFVLTLLQHNRTSACGPDFPNNLLAGGDGAVLVAPEATFAKELQRMDLTPSRFAAIQSAGNFASETATTEADDLTAALQKAGISKEAATEVRRAHAALRFRLQEFLTDLGGWESSRPWVTDQDGGHPAEPATPPPTYPKLEMPSGLPAEFADYLEGAFAWHNPVLENKGLARSAWERLLERPTAERRFKSTWAAFMLGRSWETNSPEKAIQYFRQVRELARAGFKDSIGLAAASLGLEARVELHRKHYEEALELYLAQMATGDSSTTNSLRVAAGEALANGGPALSALAKNSRTRRVLTAYLISQRDVERDADNALRSPTRKWLAAVEAAEVKDVESAEEFALAAYRANEMQLAQRWIRKAPGSPVAEWLQAKLLLHDGKLQAAAARLAKVAQYFPVAPQGTNEVAATSLKDTLFIDRSGCSPDRIPIDRQVWGELGALRLSRREYTESLDALLNSGFWMDAAFVAERVLTADELKSYVDAHWPMVSAAQTAEEEAQFGTDDICPSKLRAQIRYLLARRLTRCFRSEDARKYYPAEWLPSFDLLVQNLKGGWDTSLPANQRAQALFEAAVITRTNGMELIGTEVEPDWHIHGGNFEEGVTTVNRSTNEEATVLSASADEVRREAEHKADPEQRFHYRYQAAALAWEAAKLMPNNSDETARVLWTAGTWLKNRDPHTADLFYKSLVWRNRRTTLGAEADRRRWFPELDLNGNILPRRAKSTLPDPTLEAPDTTDSMATTTAPGDGKSAESLLETDSPVEVMPPPAEKEDAGPPTEAYEYVVQKGDSLAVILRALGEAGLNTTRDDLLSANPGVNPLKLRVGQKLFIPARIPQSEH